jgi:chromosome partitioning protein
MITYTIYSEAGGVGKSTLAANLAAAHTEHGRQVLLIDIDPQQGSVTYLLGITAPREDGEADNIARHLINQPKSDFTELIQETRFNFDILPTHNMLERLPRLLIKAEEMAEDLGESFDPNDRLRQVLADTTVPQEYDTIIVDPPATAGPHLYNAVTATRSLVLPVEPTGKGIQSVEGIQDMVVNLKDTLGFDVGVLAVVPNGVGRTTEQERYVEQIHELGYDAPVALRERSSLFEGCWDQRCTAFHYMAYHRDGRRNYEVDTLDKLRELAAHIEEVGD